MEFTLEIQEFTEDEMDILRAVAMENPELEEVFKEELEGFDNE